MNWITARLKEIEARKAELLTEIGKPEVTEERLTLIKTEAEALGAEAAELRGKMDLSDKLSPGALPKAGDTQQVRAENFSVTRRTVVTAAETRSVLVSGGTIATPTQVNGINDKQGASVSSIVDMVKVVECTGMGGNKVAYISDDADSAETQKEGNAAVAKEPTFAFVTISPTSVAVTAQISRQAQKQTPLMYESKVREQALLSLRKKASALVVDALKASELTQAVAATLTTGASKTGVVDDKTLRKIALAYGGDEGVDGGAVLFLNKKDLIAFGDVRSDSEKKAVYDIIPDTANPNTGIIKDGGLSVKYCLNSNLTTCHGTAQEAASGADVKTMFYGQPHAFELDLFSDYEIRVSEDFAITSLMDTIVGDVDIGGDVVVKNGFVCLTIKKAS